MNILAAAVVQIIGLAVLRNDDPQLGMHVILPSVAEASHVEDHSAILVFKNSDRIDDGSEWTRFPLEPMSGYSYVKLNGERIRFMVNGKNASAKIPAGLPRLKDSCPLMSELSDGYQPPAYTAAAAVAMIPNGIASACRNTNGRIDTRVWMDNTGNYQIVACDKSITFRNNAVVMIANLPTTWVDGDQNAKFPPQLHAHVYFHMAHLTPGERQTCRLQQSPGVLSCNSPQSDVAVLNRPRIFRFLALLNRDAAQPTHYPEMSTPSTTFECSNTQWP